MEPVKKTANLGHVNRLITKLYRKSKGFDPFYLIGYTDDRSKQIKLDNISISISFFHFIVVLIT